MIESIADLRGYREGVDGSAFWSAFPHDPRLPANAHLRASDRDRDAVLALLGDAYAEGRLDRSEFDDRSARANAIRTLAEVPPLVRDLISTVPAALTPSALRAEAERRYRADRRGALTYAAPAIVCWIIWVALLASGNGTPFPWPIFVTLGTAMPALRIWMNPEDHIQSRMRNIQKRQMKELRASDGSTSTTDGSTSERASSPSERASSTSKGDGSTAISDGSR